MCGAEAFGSSETTDETQVTTDTQADEVTAKDSPVAQPEVSVYFNSSHMLDVLHQAHERRAARRHTHPVRTYSE